jgi:arsenate reductase (glutaredoxin)
MLKIYHNPNCKKSREGVRYLEEKKLNFEIEFYLKDKPFTFDSLKSLIGKTGKNPIEFIRKQEQEYKELDKNIPLSNDDLINLMIKHPKLIQRPIVETDLKAVLGDPTGTIEELL